MVGLSDNPDAIVSSTAPMHGRVAVGHRVVRTIGLRTSSKMTAFVFVVALATGSLLATAAVVTQWTALFEVLSAIVALLVAQMVFTRVRR